MYKLSERQARLIALDYSNLIGKFMMKGTTLIIEEVTPRKENGYWKVYLKTYLGNKPTFYETAGHSDMIRNIFEYLKENRAISDFDFVKYDINPQLDKL